MTAATTTASETSTGLPAAARLAATFDPDRLRAELTALTRDDWRRQRTYSEDGASEEYAADWRVLPLRSPGGDERRTDAGGPGPLPFAATSWLARAPYLAEIIESVPTSVRAARLMSLAPGASVETHRDTPLGFPYGMLRLHVPIVTNDGAILVLDGEVHRWQPGTFWYGDFSRPHSIANTGTSNRVHLVIDCAITRPLFDLFPPGFVDALGVADVLFERPEIPLALPERATFRCAFALPEDFGHWSGEAFGDRPSDTADRRATVEEQPNGLVLDDGTASAPIALVHVGGGEFRLQGWTDERSLHLDRHRRVARFIIRTGSSWQVTERETTPLPASHR
ncbi:hypothetical protein GCM10022251_34930 [Phytohabitans flavus]|uniref:aspartyl/asparaginyl beta-hydroxylase domain-containing protein n=1 Tax=Phytohabitans flavus TaxID=1076124 RepID=UPI0031EA5E2B